MTDKQTNLHPKNDSSVNLKPNIISGNIPDKAVTLEKLDQSLQDNLNSHASSIATNTADIQQLKKDMVRGNQKNIAVSLGWTDEYYKYYDNGNVIYKQDYSYSQLIPCDANSQYTNNLTNCHICFYDIDGKYIRGTLGGSFITPDNCTFFVISVPTAQKDTLAVSLKTSAIDAFSENMLLGVTEWVDGRYIYYEDGVIKDNPDYSYTDDYIPISGNTKVALNVGNAHICFYDADMNYISGSTSSGFITPNNCAFIRISIRIVDKARASMSVLTKYVILGGEGGFTDFAEALYAAQNIGLPLLVMGGTWDVSEAGGWGLNIGTSIYGIGLPTITATKASFDVNFSTLNLLTDTNTNIVVDGFRIEAANCRYCIHDEQGGNEANGYYRHEIRNCILVQKTPIQESFKVPRCIGIGMGNNGQIIIDSCVLTSNVAEEIDAHTGYKGQTNPCEVIVKNCVMKTGTVSATSVGIGSGFKDTVIVSNCLVNKTPFVNTTSVDNIELIQYNNDVKAN